MRSALGESRERKGASMILCGRFKSLLTLAELSPVYKTHPLGASKSAVGVHSVL